MGKRTVTMGSRFVLLCGISSLAPDKGFTGIGINHTLWYGRVVGICHRLICLLLSKTFTTFNGSSGQIYIYQNRTVQDYIEQPRGFQI